MTLTWLDVARKYIVRDESKPKAKVTIGGVKSRIKRDMDYQLMLSCPRGEIYRHANDGSIWSVYVKPSKSGVKKRGLWAKFDAMGLKRGQVGDNEATWLFEAEKLDLVASTLKVRKRSVSKPKVVANVQP